MALVEHTIAPPLRRRRGLAASRRDVAHQNAMVSARILAILAIVLPQFAGCMVEPTKPLQHGFSNA
jgi:hypothetical protein